MEVNLVTESIKFMILGMTTVYLFLILLIYILKLQAFIIQKYFSQKSENKSPTNKTESTSSHLNVESQNDENMLVAAITAAIAEYRKNS
jgi:oxaloacetate decarboxylase gamma subunit